MSEQVDMVEVKTEPNECHEMFSACKNANMVDNHSMIDQTTSKSENHNSTHFKNKFPIMLYFVTYQINI